MSIPPIARSPDLARLREEGFEIDVRDGYVVVANVPYLNADRQVQRGLMAIALTTSGDRTGPPPDHTVWWQGAMPCHHDRTPISRIDAGCVQQQLAPDLLVQYRFSSKPLPAGRYADYYAQFTSYIRILSHEAQVVDPSATAATFAPVQTQEGESPFRYLDSASARAGIVMANTKLHLPRVALVGVGGTGSYVLDLLAKTPVEELHLYDDDVLLNHNAFRAPGAASLQRLQQQPLKVHYFAEIYDRMRRNVVPHPVRLTATNARELTDMNFVFLCMDGGPDKRAIIEHLQQAGIAFIDVGMGLDEHDGSIGGILRVTTSTPEQREHVWQHGRISFDDPDDDGNEYARNIQVAELNALNACLAVVRFKRLYGFYRDLEGEHHSLYTIDGNHLLNEDRADAN